MKEYVRFQIENEDNEILLLTTTDDLYYFIDEIYIELSKTLGKDFSVFVDMLLRNGFSFNRFVMLRFENENSWSSFIVNPRDISENLKCEVINYIRKHEELLNNSALSESAINFIKRSYNDN